jgi:hypothetical protein
LDDARVSRGAKAKEMTEFVSNALSTSMSEGAMWHDFSFLEEGRTEKRNVGGEGGRKIGETEATKRKKQEL